MEEALAGAETATGGEDGDVGLFGDPKQLNHLDRQLTAARLSLGMFTSLPTGNQEHFLASAPQIVAKAVAEAVQAGHGAAAKQMLDKAASRTPTGATDEQWRAILAGGVAELPSP